MEEIQVKPYVCGLSPFSVAKAKQELNENSRDREEAVRALKEWIEREKWIVAPMHDSRFLLSFLRCGKFSQLTARKRLEGFLYSMDSFFSFLRNSDPGDPRSLKILRDTCCYSFLPGYDKEGRKVVIRRFDRIDTSGSSYNYDDFMKAALPLFMSLLFHDENTQVNGIVFVFDFHGVSYKLMSFVGTENMKRQSKEADTAFPLRIKGIHFFNVGPVFEAVMKICRPLLPDKLKKRVHIHGHSLVSLYKNIDMSMLPEEYLPDDYDGPSAGTIESLMERNIQEFLLEPERREFLKTLFRPEFKVDKQLKSTVDAPQESFRKLVL